MREVAGGAEEYKSIGAEIRHQAASGWPAALVWRSIGESSETFQFAIAGGIILSCISASLP